MHPPPFVDLLTERPLIRCGVNIGFERKKSSVNRDYLTSTRQYRLSLPQCVNVSILAWQVVTAGLDVCNELATDFRRNLELLSLLRASSKGVGRTLHKHDAQRGPPGARRNPVVLRKSFGGRFCLARNPRRGPRLTSGPGANGGGRHFVPCALFGKSPGAWASRAMIADVALPAVSKRLKNLRLAKGEPVRIGGWAFRGLLNLPVVWDPGN